MLAQVPTIFASPGASVTITTTIYAHLETKEINTPGLQSLSNLQRSTAGASLPVANSWACFGSAPNGFFSLVGLAPMPISMIMCLAFKTEADVDVVCVLSCIVGCSCCQTKT